MGSMHHPVGAHQEIRRDRVASCHPNVFRIYLDHFDELRKVDRKRSEMISGEPSEMVKCVRETCKELG